MPIDEYPDPPDISDRKPDIYAKKSGSERIVEIETDPDADPDQHETFRRSAAQKDNTRFYGRILDDEGKRYDSFGNVPGDILSS